jgi:hypothetical protein
MCWDGILTYAQKHLHMDLKEVSWIGVDIGRGVVTEQRKGMWDGILTCGSTCIWI